VGSLNGTTAHAIPVVVVEGTRLLRESIPTMLRARGIRPVTTARDADDALRQIRRTKPRVVLLDSVIGCNDGRRLVTTVASLAPSPRIVVMDVGPNPGDAIELLRLGAMGFIVKDAAADDFLTTIRAVACGMFVLPAAVAAAVRAELMGGRGANSPRRVASRLTPRENEVRSLISTGATNKDIARELHIAVDTVKSHVHNILEKLGARTRVQIAIDQRD
jgi:DNA-binding NarL/FixJ family response regulator